MAVLPAAACTGWLELRIILATCLHKRPLDMALKIRHITRFTSPTNDTYKRRLSAGTVLAIDCAGAVNVLRLVAHTQSATASAATNGSDLAVLRFADHVNQPRDLATCLVQFEEVSVPFPPNLHSPLLRDITAC